MLDACKWVAHARFRLDQIIMPMLRHRELCITECRLSSVCTTTAVRSWCCSQISIHQHHLRLTIDRTINSFHCLKLLQPFWLGDDLIVCIECIILFLIVLHLNAIVSFWARQIELIQNGYQVNKHKELETALKIGILMINWSCFYVRFNCISDFLKFPVWNIEMISKEILLSSDFGAAMYLYLVNRWTTIMIEPQLNSRAIPLEMWTAKIYT